MIGNELMLVTSVRKNNDTTVCHGIIFSGEMDSVKSYFTESEEGIEYHDVVINVGDIVSVDAQNVNKTNFASQPQKERINNITTLFGGIKTCAQAKIPEYFEYDVVNDGNRKYVWQYMHATQRLCSGLRTISVGEISKSQEKSVKDVCLESLINHLYSSSYQLDKKLMGGKEDYLYAESALQVLKTMNGIPANKFCFKGSPITLCDDSTHDNYVLVTSRNEDGTVNGVMLENLMGKNDGKGSLRYVTTMSCAAERPLLGDLIGVEQMGDKQILRKEQTVPKHIEERIQNMYFLNNLLFEHYVQDADRFYNVVYNAQMGIARGLAILLRDAAVVASSKANTEEEQNKIALYEVLSKNLHGDYLEARKEPNVKTIAKINKEVNLTKPMVDLPKVALSDDKSVQKTLDMF